MPRPFDLLVIGDANPDVVVGPVPRTPEFGQREQLVGTGRLLPGGSAAITACGAARLGLRVTFAGRVGDDAAGAFVRTALAGRGVDVSALATDPELPTPLTTVLTHGADRAILTAPGCLAATGPQDVPDRLLAAARHVHAGSFFLMPRLARSLGDLFARARGHGAATSLDTNDDPAQRWDPELLGPVLKSVDHLLPNAAEARALAATLAPGSAEEVSEGTPEGDRPGTGPASAAAALARLGPLVVVKDGAAGALAHDGAVLTRTAAVPADPVDTVGAGDSFDAGFIAAVLHGLDLPAALSFAAACGALSTRAHGGTAAQPTWDEARAAALTTRPGSHA
ncbi:carbohydrate kinase family protein [Streptomyces albofaciens JCM 4342]|uniref:carbohydrate kinase family protein n=1 Tax=Streptomyces albofaciens TaxID=66866 RepID=UPI0012397561|nr:carbohydrate kinase family protein [Streptomyces albofaciens]KAA6222924.1 carbohydrate kinase family protein [Streptomyces albofaciens JCM 4342]